MIATAAAWFFSLREKLPLEPEERQLGNVETNGFVEVVADGDVTIYGAGRWVGTGGELVQLSTSR